MKKGKRPVCRVLLVLAAVLILGWFCLYVALDSDITIKYQTRHDGGITPEELDKAAYASLGPWKAGFRGGRLSDLVREDYGFYNESIIYYQYANYSLPAFLVGEDVFVTSNVAIDPLDGYSIRTIHFIGPGRAIEHAQNNWQDQENYATHTNPIH